jgi:hypothetical protein
MSRTTALGVGLLLVSALGLGGCATADGPSFQEAKPATVASGKALVYVFRKHAEPTMWSTSILVDDRELASLSQGGFTWAHVTPGQHAFRGVWPTGSGQRDSVINVDLQAGHTYFLELTGIARMTGVGPTLGGQTTVYYRMGSGLNELRPEAAEPIVAGCCRFQKPVLSDF